ncbi:MAG: hypothetical protein GXP29_06060 [Planctomycetes bacterium]|nr:hypothetical protein [Planctomycetota bacterium]
MNKDGESMANDAELTAGDGPSPQSEVTPPVKKKRRWLRLIVIASVLMFVLLVGVVALAPWLVSTAAATRYAESFINEQTDGAISLGNVNLSWFDDCTLTNVAMADAEGRDLFRADSISIPGGVWGVLRRFDIPDEVQIDAPLVVVYTAEGSGDSDSSNNSDSLENDSSADADDAASSGSGPMRIPAIKVVIRKGRVRIVGDKPSNAGEPESADYLIDDLTADIATDSQGNLTASVTGRTPEGSNLKVDGLFEDVLGLINGSFDLANKKGSARIYSDGPIDLKRLSRAIPAEYRASGKVTLDLGVTIENGELRGNLKTELVDIAAEGIGGADQLPPGRLGLVATVLIDGKTATGRFDLEGDAGVAGADFKWPYRDAGPMPDVGEFGESIMAGVVPELPGLALNMSGSLDLAVLARAFPGILNLNDDVSLAEGVLELHELAVNGGQRPTAKLAASLRDVVANTPSGAVRWEPASVELDIASGDDNSLKVRRAFIDANVAKLEASGDLDRLQATISGDLDRVRTRISPLFDLGVDELAGTFETQIELSRASGDRVNATCDLTANQIRYRSGETNLNLPVAKAKARWIVQLKDNEVVEIQADETNVDLGGSITASATGRFNISNGGFSLDVAAPQVQLEQLVALLAGFGVDTGELQRGSVSGTARLERADENAPILSSGDLSARGLQVGTSPQQADLSWNGLRLDTVAERLSVDSVSLESAIAALNVNKGEVSYGSDFRMSGQMKGRADIRKCAKLLGTQGDASAMDNVAGVLVFDANCNADGQQTALKGQASIQDFAFASEDGSVFRDQISATFDARVNTATDSITFDRFMVTGDSGSVDIAGKLDAYSTSQNIQLDGNLKFDWARIMKVVYEMAPAMRDVVTITGRNDSRINVRGPLNLPDRSPPFREASFGANLGWQSAEVAGIPLGSLKLEPSFREGKLTLPLTQIQAAGGTVDFNADPPMLKTPDRLRLLKGIAVTPRLGQQLLSRFNPIFGSATKMDGTLDLTINQLAMPLGDAMNQTGGGSGRLDMNEFHISPDPFLVTLFELGGLGRSELYSINVSGMDFVIQEGRIQYDDFTLNFADHSFDLKFRGSVGFDDTVDLIVSIPVQEQLLRRLKVQGPVGEYAKRLAGTRVEIPMTGSRSNPKLDFAQVDVGSLLKDVVTDTLLDPNALLGVLGQAAGKDGDGKSKTGRKTGAGSGTKGKRKAGAKRRGTKGNKAKGKKKRGVGGLLDDVLKGKKGEGKKDPKKGKKRKGKRRGTGRKRSGER